MNQDSVPTIPRPAPEAIALLEAVISGLFPEFDYKPSTVKKTGFRSRTHKAVALVMEDLAQDQAYIQQEGPGQYRVWSFPNFDHHYTVHLSATVGHEHTCSCWDTAGKQLCYHIMAASIKAAICLRALQPGLFALAQPLASQPTTRSRKKSTPVPPAPQAAPRKAAQPVTRSNPSKSKSSPIPALEAPSARRVTLYHDFDEPDDDEIPF